MNASWFKRGLSLLMSLILVVPVVAFAQEEPVSAVVEEVMSAYVDEPVAELPEMALGLPEGLTIEETMEELFEEPTEEPIEETEEESTEEPVEEPTGEPVEETEEEPTEKPVEEPSGEPVEEPIEEPTEEPAEESADTPVEDSVEVTVLPGFTFPEDIPMPEVFLSADGECSHWYNTMSYVTFGSGKLTDIKKYENCDGETHWAIGDIYRMTVCYDCGATLEHTLLAKNGRVKQRHTPNSKSACTKCKVKVNTKITTEVRQVYVPYDDMEKAVHDGDTATHLWKGSLIERTYEIDPMYGESYNMDLDVVIEADVEWREAHAMNGSYCQGCDYVADSACAHANVEMRPYYYNWPYSAPGDEFQHRYLGDWAEELYCADCGMQRSTHPETGEDYPKWHFGDDVLQDHEYINGVCDDCGHKAAFTLSDKTLKLGIGEKYTLGYVFENELGANAVTFSTSKSSIAAVNKTTGEITPKKVGTVTITAKAANGKKVTCKVTVGKKPTSIKLNKTEIVLGVGETFKLTTKLSSKSYSHIQWTVASENAAVSVDASGVVTANTEGTAIITAATYNGKTAQCAVTVKAAPTDADIGIALDKAVIGVKEVIYAHAGMAENCAGKITFSVEGDAATIDASTGKITGKTVGTVAVRAEAYNGASATAQLEVKAAPSKIRITNAPKKMGVGQKYTLDVKIGADGEDCAGSWTFASSNKKIATVNKTTGEITAKKTGTVKITVTSYHSKKVKHTVSIKVYKKPSSIKLNKSEIVLGVGETFKLTAKLSSGSYSPVIWTAESENAAVSVDASGVVTANTEGTAIISAATYNGKTAQCTVTVKTAPTDADIGITLDKTVIGVKEAIYAHASTAEDCAGAITFSVEGDAATIDASTGKVTGKAVGIVTVRAEAYNGASATAQLEVKAAPSKIRITNAPKKMGIGQKYTLDVKIGADGEDCAGTWTFSSSNKKIATVNKATGEITAKKAGTVKITVTSHHNKKVKQTVTIKVYKKPTSVKLNKTTLYLGMGETFKLTTKLSSGSYSPVTWTTSYENDPATVDQSGLVSGVYEGSTFVTATLYNGKSATCEVIVGCAPEYVDFGFDSMILHAGQKETFAAYPMSSKGTAYGKVTYTSSDTSIATVSSAGKVTAKKQGYVTITAQAYAGEADSYELMVLPAIKSVKINIPSRIPVGSIYGYDPETGAYTDFGIFDYISVSPNSTGVTGLSAISVTSIKSSKTSVADVGYLEEDGMPVLVALKKGKFTLTVKTYNGKTAKKTITVY